MVSLMVGANVAGPNSLKSALLNIIRKYELLLESEVAAGQQKLNTSPGSAFKL